MYVLISTLQGSYRDSMYKSTGWAEWYDRSDNLVCTKDVSISRLAIRKPDKLQDYLTTFNRIEGKARRKMVDSEAEDVQDIWAMGMCQNSMGYLSEQRSDAVCPRLVKKINRSQAGWETD